MRASLRAVIQVGGHITRSRMARQSLPRQLRIRPLSAAAAGRIPHVWGDIKTPSTDPSSASSTSSTTSPSSSGGGTRRVRRRPSAEEEGGAQSAEEVQTCFITESAAFFKKVEAGVASMKPLNDPFDIIIDDFELCIDLGVGKGKFILQKDLVQNQLVLLSPNSGVNKYQYDAQGKRWVSIASDRHDLVGMITRDLIRLCVGCPQIET